MVTRVALSSAALVLVVVALATGAAAAQAAAIPDSESGRCALAYLDAFNSGDDEAVKAFFSGCLAPAAQAQRPMEQRLAMTRQIRSQLGRLELRKLVAADARGLTLLVESEKGGWLELSFVAEPGSGKLTGIRLEQAEPPTVDQGGPASWEELPTALDAHLKKLASEGSFSGVALVARGDAVVFLNAYGLADRSFAVPVRPDTRFNLGSINKLFTKVAVAQLLQTGQLSLDDTIATVLPDYPNREVAGKVTVRQLLDFTSGLGDFFGERFDATPKDRLRDNRDYLPLFVDEPLLFTPGSDHRYSNAGYVVLGLIVEKVSGKSYYDYVRERIFLPAGMKDTDSFEADVPTVNLAEGYTTTWNGGEHPGEPLRANVYTRPARGSAAGGGYSTAEDLLRFVRALRGGKLLRPDGTAWVLGGPEPGSTEAATTPPEAAGLGFAGGAPGINASLEVDGDVVVVVLANLDPPAATSVGRTVTRWIRRLR